MSQLIPRVFKDGVNPAPGVLGFQGNPDIYGVGIRVGYYTQALSLPLATFFVPAEAPFLQSVNTAFIIAVVLGVGLLSRDPSDTYAVEVYLLLHITWSITFGCLGLSRHLSHLHQIVRRLSWLAFNGYSVWFWWAGLDHMRRTPYIESPDGPTYVLFVTRGDLFGWVRTMFKITTLLLVGDVFAFASTISSILQSRRIDSIMTTSFQNHLKKLFQEELERGRHAAIRNKASRLDQDNSNQDLTAFSLLPPAQLHKRRTRSLCSMRRLSRQSYELGDGIGELKPAQNMTQGLSIISNSSSGSPNPTYALTYNSSAPPRFSHSSLAQDLLATHTYWLALLYPNRTREKAPTHILSFSRFSLASYLIAYGEGYSTFPSPYILILLYRLFTTRPPVLSQTSPPLTDMFGIIAHFYSLAPPAKPYTRRRRWTEWARGYLTFSIFCMLVLNVELSIQWSGIRGVQNMNSVGQLIPACLGTGGLLKVIWAACKQRWRKKASYPVVGEHEGVSHIGKEVAELFSTLAGERQEWGDG